MHYIKPLAASQYDFPILEHTVRSSLWWDEGCNFKRLLTETCSIPVWCSVKIGLPLSFSCTCSYIHTDTHTHADTLPLFCHLFLNTFHSNHLVVHHPVVALWCCEKTNHPHYKAIKGGLNPLTGAWRKCHLKVSLSTSHRTGNYFRLHEKDKSARRKKKRIFLSHVFCTSG